MATESSSSPVNFVPMLIYGALGGVMTVLFLLAPLLGRRPDVLSALAAAAGLAATGSLALLEVKVMASTLVLFSKTYRPLARS